jgi:Ino eighty subunit 1
MLSCIYNRGHSTEKLYLTDAPRLKIMLKAVLLEGEDSKTLPSTLDQFTEQLEAGKVPSTSICNMLLSFALRPDPAHEKFFSDYPSNINFLTLFTPIPVRSSEKAKAFLYIVHHYLEHPEQRNPFEDEDRPDQMPKLNVLSQEEYEALGENLDTPEEVQFGFEMKAQRIQCKEELALQKQEEERVKADPDAASLVDSSQGTTGKAATMWAKPKKARGPAAHGSGKKRKRHSDPLIAELTEGVEQDLAESEFGEDEIELYPRDRHSMYCVRIF